MRGESLRPWGITLLRVIIGVIFLMHGWQKLTAFGVNGVTGMFANLGIPLPNVFAIIVIAVELVGGAMLIIGLGTRWAALLNGFDMVVAILLVHLRNGFFSPKGIEHPLSLLAACLCLVLAGPGAGSVDEVIGTRPRNSH
jgi:putative oxidoreductase